MHVKSPTESTNSINREALFRKNLPTRSKKRPYALCAFARAGLVPGLIGRGFLCLSPIYTFSVEIPGWSTFFCLNPGLICILSIAV